MSSRKYDQPEKRIESWLNEQIRRMGGISYKFVSPMNPGVPDRIYLMPGGAVWFVELKTEIGRLANIQKWQGDRIRGIGCRYRVIKGMDQARAFVEELENEIHL